MGLDVDVDVDGDGGGDAARPSRPPQVVASDLRAVVVLVVDGLGWHQLGATDVGPFLAERMADQPRPGRSVLPSTTSTNLVSIGTGRHGGDHGILGYTMVLDGSLFNTLVWRDGPRGGGADARTTVVPEAMVPRPTMLERLAMAGARTAAVLQPGFLDSGLTRAGLRGGQRRAAAGLHDTLGVALDVVAEVDAPTVVYAHHPSVDVAGHGFGPHTGPWDKAVGEVDRSLAAVVDRLPADVAVVLTADHGMVAMAEQDLTEVTDDHPLLDGVALVAGEPRMRTLVVDDGVDPTTVADRVREALGERALVRTSVDAVADGWFGPDVPPAHVRRLGDVVVASTVGSMPHPRIDPRRGRLDGMHGGLTAAERDVPLLVLRGGG